MSTEDFPHSIRLPTRKVYTFKGSLFDDMEAIPFNYKNHYESSIPRMNTRDFYNHQRLWPTAYEDIYGTTVPSTPTGTANMNSKATGIFNSIRNRIQGEYDVHKELIGDFRNILNNDVDKLRLKNAASMSFTSRGAGKAAMIGAVANVAYNWNDHNTSTIGDIATGATAGILAKGVLGIAGEYKHLKKFY